jgi:hypothetical protein
MSCGNDILKPYPSEHACRVRDPDNFQKNSFRSKDIAHGVRMILGRLKDETTMTTMSYRFDKNVFTAQEAKDWCKKHKINCILFEQAKAELIETFLEKIRF